MALTVPQWYSPPKHVTILVKPENIRKSPLGHEVVIYCDVGEERFSAVVPMHSLNEVSGTVQAAEVGQLGDSIFVSFPATSEGTATWVIRKDVLPTLLMKR